jgi:uncharacterized protein (DUF1800 family)
MAVTPTTSDQLDPARAWLPWEPSAVDPWGPKWAAHLYRRAAFGAGREELIEAERLGPQGTLDLLLRGRPGAETVLETMTDVGRIAAERDEAGDDLRGWWLYCALQGGHPLREKMTLFWHNHFATSIAKVASALAMFRQNSLFRRHALGRFGPLFQAVSRDPAMLLWLDSNSNVKGKPNENYARELMELFSLGVGHYTEKDIREAARAFTGWRTDGTAFTFDSRFHDAGPKTVLGQTGSWDGGDVVRIVLEQPAAARFLVGKLYAFLVSEQPAPPAGLLEPLCDLFRKSDYDVAALLRIILSSRHFYSAAAFRRRIKGPTEYVLGAVQAVYRRYGEGDADFRPLPQLVLVSRIGAMGQSLFAPPNVKGWPGGTSWLNTSTVLERDNFAQALALGTLWGDATRQAAERPAPPRPALGQFFAKPDRILPTDTPEEPPPPRAFDAARLLEEEPASRPEDVVHTLLDLYVPGGVRPEARAKLVAFVGQGNPTGPARARRAREAVHAILTMPEYNLA